MDDPPLPTGVGSSTSLRRLQHPLEEGPLWPILGTVVWSILALLIGVPVLILFALICPICVVIKWLSASVSGSSKDCSFPGRDVNSQVLHAVLVFGGNLQVKTLQELVLYRVIPRYPKLTYKYHNHTGLWVEDPKFNISRHVFSVPRSNGEESLWTLHGLTSEKPPWELQVYERPTETMLVFRYHQGLVEIHVLVNLLCTALSDSSSSYIEVASRNTFYFCVELIRACIVAPLTVLLWLLMSTKDQNILTEKPHWTGRFNVTLSSAVPLSKVNRIKQVTRSTTNCVLLSALAGSMRKFLQSCGITQPPDMQVVIPVSQFGTVWPIVVPLPVGTEGSVPRIWDTRRILRRVKSNSEPLIGFLTMSALLSTVPERRAYSILSKLTHQKATLQFSSVIGPETSLLVGGCPLKSLYAILPPQSEIGIAVTFISYAGNIFITILSDTSLSSVSSLLLHNFKTQVDILDNLLKNRRVPNDKKDSIYRFRNVAQSPIKELAYRLSHIQHEILRINDRVCFDSSCDNLNLFKAEFSSLGELQRSKPNTNETKEFDEQYKPLRTTSYPVIYSPNRYRADMCSPCHTKGVSSTRAILKRRKGGHCSSYKDIQEGIQRRTSM